MARTAVVAGTATAVSGRVARRQNNRWARQEEEQYAQQQAQQAPPPAPAPAAGGENATIEQLKQLAELKAQGILTEEEFAAQKAKLLG
ncbi:MAG: SHOCT domain-containing protein [Solirubrobacterales bacterium]